MTRLSKLAQLLDLLEMIGSQPVTSGVIDVRSEETGTVGQVTLAEGKICTVQGTEVLTRIGELLAEHEPRSVLALEAALKESRVRGEFVGEVLLRMGVVPVERLRSCLREQTAARLVQMAETLRARPSTARLCSPERVTTHLSFSLTEIYFEAARPNLTASRCPVQAILTGAVGLGETCVLFERGANNLVVPVAMRSNVDVSLDMVIETQRTVARVTSVVPALAGESGPRVISHDTAKRPMVLVAVHERCLTVSCSDTASRDKVVDFFDAERGAGGGGSNALAPSAA